MVLIVFLAIKILRRNQVPIICSAQPLFIFNTGHPAACIQDLYFFWYKITNSNDNFEIFIFVTLIFLSITHLTLTWPHGAPLQYMCILPPPPFWSLTPPPPVCTCLIYVSESGWGSLWWIQIPWLQLFSQPQIRQPSILSGVGFKSLNKRYYLLCNTNASFKMPATL